MIAIKRAASIVRDGGVVAYPTEGVYGLGCRPDDRHAVMRICSIKRRDPDAGMVLLAADRKQLDGWIDLRGAAEELASRPERPVTYIVAAGPLTPDWIRGRHVGVAVRISTHPVATALCAAAGMPLVSTSANPSGRPPARNALVLRRNLGKLVDCVVPGRCGPAHGPSEIRDLATGTVIRSTRS